MNPDVVIYEYMDTFYCCEVPKDRYCEEMVTEHMLCYLCSGEMELISPQRKYKLKKGDAFFVRRNHMMRKIKQPSLNGEPFKGLFLQLKHPFLKKILSEHNVTVPLVADKSISNAPYVMLEKKATEVYLEVGFKSLSHFPTAFKKEFGISPSAL